MLKIEVWSPPVWDEVVISWSDILERHNWQDINIRLAKTPGECYHLHGYRNTEGIAFRFEQPDNAILFSLRCS